MSVLTTTVGPEIDLGGGRIIQSYRATVGSASAADEWMSTNLLRIDGILGVAVVGSAGLAPVKATGTITCLVADPVAGDTISIGDGVTTQVYTVDATPEVGNGDQNDVDLSATIATFGASLTAAINALVEGTSTTFNEYTKPNKWVTAVFADPIITVTALVPGTVGNAITLAQTGDTVSVSAATLTGGLDAGSVNVVPNAQGTGVAEYVNMGDIGIEAPSVVAVEVTVIGVRR